MQRRTAEASQPLAMVIGYSSTKVPLLCDLSLIYSEAQWATSGRKNPYMAWDIPLVTEQTPDGVPASVLMAKMGTALHLSHLCKSMGRGNIAGQSILKGKSSETSTVTVDAHSLYTECNSLGMSILPIARAQLAFDATYLALNNPLAAVTIPDKDNDPYAHLVRRVLWVCKTSSFPRTPPAHMCPSSSGHRSVLWSSDALSDATRSRERSFLTSGHA